VAVAQVAGLVSAGTARYVERFLDDAERRGAPAAVIALDTPGGYEGPARRVVQRIEGSAIPVIVFVAPDGARAAGAGLLVLQAADLAAMAPATSLSAGGQGQPAGPGQGAAGDSASGTPPPRPAGPPPVATAAAFARGLALARGRNGAWVAEAVRQGATLSASEALRLRVVDEVASDVDDLLAKLDGRPVTGPWGTRTLATRGLPTERLAPAWWEGWLDALVDPNVAYLLFAIGLFALVVELATPGATVPGVLGVACLAAALYAFTNLPVDWAGVAALCAAAGLLLAETRASSHGLLALAGLATFAAGSLLLFRPPGPSLYGAPATLNPWLVVGLGAGTAVLFGWVIRQSLAMLHRPHLNAPPAPGAVGIAGRVVDATGTVHVGGRTWTAEWPAGSVQPGEAVRVVGRRGLRLLVERSPEPPPEGR
jgi:membrane-bound serine protease (ClpP class)